jgi:hypothetical protein
VRNSGVFVLAAGALALGACMPSSPPAGVSTNAQLRARLTQSCVTVLQGSGVSAGASSKCGCYSDRMMKAMSPADLAELRATGAYSANASAKARETLAVCKIKR